jgi:hypothetical protein
MFVAMYTFEPRKLGRRWYVVIPQIAGGEAGTAVVCNSAGAALAFALKRDALNAAHQAATLALGPHGAPYCLIEGIHQGARGTVRV